MSEGWLRASHRGVARPPYDNLGLPYHSHAAEDDQAVETGEPLALVFAMSPISTVFDAGHRIRVTITCADADNMEVLNRTALPTVQLYHDRRFPSGVVLPVVLR